MKMTLSKINGFTSLALTIIGVLLCLHQGYSTVVPIGSCILIFSESCPRSEVQFHLYTRNSPNSSELVYVSDVFDNVTSSSFNSSWPNKIIIHGYNADMNLDVLQNIKSAYLNKGDFNIWFVNWPDLCRTPCYVISVYNLDQVGKCVAQMIKRIKKYTTGDPDFHIIGFSLGAHVAAYTSKYLKPFKLPRITGLDPAMPMFASRDKDSRLDPEDAKFVDVIHTSAFLQGQYARSGHVDFYMNGGIEQPGCWNTSNPFDCNHRRAPQYFAESINSEEGFWGWPCTGIINYILDMCPVKYPLKVMGESCLNKSRGFYIVPTKSNKPFAKGQIIIESIKPNQNTSNELKAISREKKNKSGKRRGKNKDVTAKVKYTSTEKMNISKESTTEETNSEARTTENINSNEKITQVINSEVKTTGEINSEKSITQVINSEESIPEEVNTEGKTTEESTTFGSNNDLDNSTDNDEQLDFRFSSKGNEIEFSDASNINETSQKIDPITTTSTEVSKYRYIYKVPRNKKKSASSK